MQAVVDVWQLFEAEFLKLWDDQSHKGDAFPAVLFGPSVHQGLQAQQVSRCAHFAEVVALAVQFGLIPAPMLKEVDPRF